MLTDWYFVEAQNMAVTVPWLVFQSNEAGGKRWTAE